MGPMAFLVTWSDDYIFIIEETRIMYRSVIRIHLGDLGTDVRVGLKLKISDQIDHEEPAWFIYFRAGFSGRFCNSNL
jgi:hypothetical protein